MSNIGPGPAKYTLPSTIGYNGHDATRDRRPAFTMALRLPISTNNVGPGAAKYDPHGQTHVGGQHVSAYMGRRFDEAGVSNKSPGPAKYMLPALIGRERIRNWLLTSPDFTMAQRFLAGSDQAHKFGPGPANYMLPDTFGKQMKNIYPNRGPQYTMAVILKTFGQNVSPGPAKYNTRPQYKCVGITMAGRPTDHPGSVSPAPNGVNLAEYKPGKRRPLYSMGRRTVRNPMILPEDNCC